ncbi:MAG: 23S ribosomal RNA methyltransferase Erm [Halanaerobiaceae bacterium]|nr:23S ribosomal RNA methyltransferase Erm [Halanaerobiaceae bacterium]
MMIIFIKNFLTMFADRDNVEIINQDFLKYRLSEDKRYKVFASIPFNITAEISNKLTDIEKAPQDAYLVVQKEAAWKYAGYPYYRESLRSLFLKPYFELKIIYSLKRTDFRPVPDVDAVMLHIRKRRKLLLKEEEGRLYQDFVSYIFTQNNKGLRDKSKKIFSYRQIKRLAGDNGFKMDVNPMELRFEQWYRLYRFFSGHVDQEKQLLVKGAYSKLMKEQRRLDKLHHNRKQGRKFSR